VPPDLLAVEINIRDIVRCPEINEEASVLLSLIIKRFSVPDRTFVKEQALLLSIPISRHL